eukprot:14035866-Alexandrium_andersonii.AAC.1
MSASLVGSEMCIRDSPTHGAFGELASWGPPGPRPPLRGCCRPLDPPWACLLYTSDAADDM